MKPTDRDWPTCACGCGEPVPVRKATNPELGLKIGDPCFYVAGHKSRGDRKQVVNGMVACSKCKVVQPLEAFPRESKRANGRAPQCSACALARQHAYRNRHPERVRAAEKARYNPERQRAAEARYKERHRDHYLDNARIHASARRARLREVFVEHVHPLVVLEMDDGVCGICGEDVDPFNFEVDHIIPLIKGGEHSYANTQLAHKSCNSRKRDRITI
jgi:5-methylcytosine-specific restriction endonuclease McrA